MHSPSIIRLDNYKRTAISNIIYITINFYTQSTRVEMTKVVLNEWNNILQIGIYINSVTMIKVGQKVAYDQQFEAKLVKEKPGSRLIQ